MSDPAPPPCEICEQYRMEDARWILESHINGLHQELAALTAENERLRDSVLWTRAERNRLSREARALLTEEGKP